VQTVKFCVFKALFTLLRYVAWILFFLILAIILRVFIGEFFYIPSNSMNSTLYQGDVVFVNKTNYGALLPRSPADIPLVPGLMYFKLIEQWLSKKYWDYHRMPAFGGIKQGDVVAFRFSQNSGMFIKRCIALPGETLRIEHDVVFVNERKQSLPDSARLYYRIQTQTGKYTNEELQRMISRYDQLAETSLNGCVLRLTSQFAEALDKNSQVRFLVHAEDASSGGSQKYFPYKVSLHWNRSNYGPVVVPKKGMTVRLDTANLAFYRSIIQDSEESRLEVKGNTIFINGKRAQAYTFKMNYYFMMGDNRLDSFDSRYSGFVAEDKVIGKATCVLFSLEKDPWQKKRFRIERVIKSV
jgi:signal peptidase I